MLIAFQRQNFVLDSVVRGPTVSNNDPLALMDVDDRVIIRDRNVSLVSRATLVAAWLPRILLES
jgi:hypothetical protein